MPLSFPFLFVSHLRIPWSVFTDHPLSLSSGFPSYSTSRRLFSSTTAWYPSWWSRRGACLDVARGAVRDWLRQNIFEGKVERVTEMRNRVLGVVLAACMNAWTIFPSCDSVNLRGLSTAKKKICLVEMYGDFASPMFQDIHLSSALSEIREEESPPCRLTLGHCRFLLQCCFSISRSLYLHQETEMIPFPIPRHQMVVNSHTVFCIHAQHKKPPIPDRPTHFQSRPLPCREHSYCFGLLPRSNLSASTSI